MMLAIFTVGLTAGSPNLSEIVRRSRRARDLHRPERMLLAFAALFIVLLAETGRVPVDNPATHLELTMIHEAMLLEYSGAYLALIEWGASVKQLVLMTLLANVFFPIGHRDEIRSPRDRLGLRRSSSARSVVLAAVVVLVETTNAKLRLFRVPELMAVALGLGFLALAMRFF